MVSKQLYRRLLPLLVTRFMRFKEKHGADREGFVMELKRLNVLDEPEMERITNGYFLSKEPTLIWLIEWTLTYEMRQVFEVYGMVPDFAYVLVHPYKFIGHLFQVIAGQWLISGGADMTVHEMDKFLKVCLQEHLERNVPIVPHNTVGPVERTKDWRSEMLELHQRLWSEFPDLRPYIRYHEKWFQAPPSAVDKSTLAKDIRHLGKAISELADCLKKSPSPPAPAPSPPPAAPAAVAEPKKSEKTEKRSSRRERQAAAAASSSSSGSEDDAVAREEKRTISAKLHSDDEETSRKRQSSSSESSDSD